MERLFRSPLSKTVDQGARISRIGWLEIEIPNDKKREEKEGFEVPIPHLVIGSPKFKELDLLVKLNRLPSSVTVRMSMEVKVEGGVHLKFYKKDPNQPKGIPITSFEIKPVMKDIQEKMLRFLDYAKNADKLFLDIQDTMGEKTIDANGKEIVMDKVIRVSFEKEKSKPKDRKFLYRKTDSIITQVAREGVH